MAQSVTRYRLEALADLEELVVYTRETYGDDKARQYIAEIQVTCSMLDTFPHLGPSVPRHEPLRQRRVSKHVIFYLPRDGGEVEVVRILHQERLHEDLL